jgi:hypothetical protein
MLGGEAVGAISGVWCVMLVHNGREKGWSLLLCREFGSDDLVRVWKGD